ncbi:MAG: protein kinase [Myxococcota bacterium]
MAPSRTLRVGKANMGSCEDYNAEAPQGPETCGSCPKRDLTANWADDPRLGTLISGKYRIMDVLGEGAMARVYGAVHEHLGLELAIKILHDHVAVDPSVTRRFHREAQAASRLVHPNSLQTIDFGRSDDGTFYLAMELLDGDDLLTILQHDTPLSPKRIIELLSQALLAVDEAHRVGIVHRDLKPENVIVLDAGGGSEHVKVCDFGIAKIVGEKGSAITIADLVCGTPEYMAPEQARGEDVDHRADIYSIGCILYHLLTGSPPFQTSTALGTITRHLTSVAPPPRVRHPELYIPRALEAICQRAMAKERDHRFRNAGDMRDALLCCLELLGPSAVSQLGTVKRDRTRRLARKIASKRADKNRSTWLFAAATSSLAVGFLAFNWSILRTPGPERLPYAAAKAPDTQQASRPRQNETLHELHRTLSPLSNDGVRSEQAESRIEAVDTSLGEHRLLDERKTQTTKEAWLGRRRTTQPIANEQESASAVQRRLEAQKFSFEDGRIKFLSNNVLGAIAAYEKAALDHPRDADVHRELARAYMRIGRLIQGREAYRRYLELDPEANDREVVNAILEQFEALPEDESMPVQDKNP